MSGQTARNTCRILVIKPGKKRLLGRPSFRLEDNIRLDFREVE